MDQALWDQSAQISVESGVIAEPPSQGVFRTDLAEVALELLDGDLTGENYMPIEVDLVEGGE